MFAPSMLLLATVPAAPAFPPPRWWEEGGAAVMAFSRGRVGGASRVAGASADAVALGQGAVRPARGRRPRQLQPRRHAGQLDHRGRKLKGCVLLYSRCVNKQLFRATRNRNSRDPRRRIAVPRSAARPGVRSGAAATAAAAAAAAGAGVGAGAGARPLALERSRSRRPAASTGAEPEPEPEPEEPEPELAIYRQAGCEMDRKQVAEATLAALSR
eukprot:COSAG04_NODE_3907_length_2432_cov_1.663523_1_plen_213_part_10